ncbi:hypothetical protein CS063_12035 [Sporanaerobium hydrogeniformans]|uniref:Uncharacterized protein n=1 Tax=Sporanaerobium hydrogeniformans TaxID=3072179 RepID=A0AC61DA94_9FIRM|nr:hypothetical protein [Sporanaerobium hydrogeniformans]PHV70201.1 hypothetical protein CS063_12035 [Sporanaerobium hydrogeniformans]
MHTLLQISELTKAPLSANEIIVKQIKITNISHSYINDLKLLLPCETSSIVESAIIRERGSLSFEGNITALEMGNLAPSETAYFEYSFKATPESSSLSPHILLSYIDEDTGQKATNQLNLLLDPTDE